MPLTACPRRTPRSSCHPCGGAISSSSPSGSCTRQRYATPRAAARYRAPVVLAAEGEYPGSTVSSTQPHGSAPRLDADTHRHGRERPSTRTTVPVERSPPCPTNRLHSPIQWLRWIGRSAKRLAVFVLGVVVLGAGIAMLALPGPGPAGHPPRPGHPGHRVRLGRTGTRPHHHQGGLGRDQRVLEEERPPRPGRLGPGPDRRWCPGGGAHRRPPGGGCDGDVGGPDRVGDPAAQVQKWLEAKSAARTRIRLGLHRYVLPVPVDPAAARAGHARATASCSARTSPTTPATASPPSSTPRTTRPAPPAAPG